ncbi:hypothetical protein [Acidovorax sp. M2(2025)]|uniref:hypothetical protein n=1 Tax=Acidovorax sp. M2(2025) TaxID=3411355 RepID=UPI003BF4A7E8
MISEATILFLQSSAAVFMAADYFFREEERSPINSAIQRALIPMNQQIDADVRFRVQSATQNLASLIVSALFLLLGWLVVAFLLPAIGGAVGPWVVVLLSLLALGLVAGGMPKLLTAIVGYLIPVAMATSIGLVLKFLIRCPKGTVFGIGFLFLVASFACRWYNL